MYSGNENPVEVYNQANKTGKNRYKSQLSSGLSGYLPSLDGILKNTEAASEVSLGLVEIPLKKIIGTYSHSRSTSFADNFMPLASKDSEFGSKWANLYKAHITEGIRDPIKVYEYLNWFYVIEGNKRVSVLKFVDAYSITADVRRLIPKMDISDQTIRLYYEFLDFNKKTGLFTIWFSKEGSFSKLGALLDGYTPKLQFEKNKFSHFRKFVYNPFRKIYHNVGGTKLKITTGDALLEYLKIYGMPQEISELENIDNIKKFLEELKVISEGDEIEFSTKPLKDKAKKNVLSTITDLVTSKKKLKIAFVYAKTVQSSGWTYAHDLGRLHIESLLGNQIETTYIENVPESDEAYDHIKKLAEDENDIIFTTSPTYIAPTLKAALEFPDCTFLNCSETHSFKNVSTFFGRIHEPRFLLGVIAGSLTKTNTIGYVATYPISEVITGINAFALGAKMVNPYIKVKVEWTKKWDCHISSKDLAINLHKSGADIISHDDLPTPGDKSKQYGLYSIFYDEKSNTYKTREQYAVPIWHWGIFYYKLINNILSSSIRDILDLGHSRSQLLSFWWGMDSGMVDIFYSLTYVPRETQKLVDLFKKMIIQNELNVFSGPIYDQEKNLKISEGNNATTEEILYMDWFVDIIEGEIPIIEKNSKVNDPLTDMLGVKKINK